jgi:membrane protein DedA with SNARE-associated domain
MQLSHYLMAIFAGRFIRFTLLGLLTIKFGPDVLRIVTLAVRKHLALVGLIAAVGLLAWFVKQRAAARAKSTVLG